MLHLTCSQPREHGPPALPSLMTAVAAQTSQPPSNHHCVGHDSKKRLLHISTAIRSVEQSRLWVCSLCSLPHLWQPRVGSRLMASLHSELANLCNVFGRTLQPERKCHVSSLHDVSHYGVSDIHISKMLTARGHLVIPNLISQIP